jgi:hypothetical protein
MHLEAAGCDATRSMLLGTLLDVLGLTWGGGWSSPAADDEQRGENILGRSGSPQSPSTTDENEFKMLMMQAVPGHVASLNDSFEFKRLVCSPSCSSLESFAC